MDQLKSLFTKYLNNKANAQEIDELLDYIHIEKENTSLDTYIYNALSEDFTDSPELESSVNEIYAGIKERIFPEHIAPVSNLSLKPVKWLAIAASLVLISGIAEYFYKSQQTKKISEANQFATYIAPGRNKVLLTLAGGEKMTLDDSNNGNLPVQNGVRLHKTGSGQLTYTTLKTQNGQADQVAYNIAETPKGGQYQLKLSDGTKVFLNAASSLRYPTKFTGKQRIVEIKGEGYFEVAKDRDHPFIVKAGQQRVEVLGTHFNLNSYQDEPSVNTTLFEGSVRINGKTLLKPGQQANLYPSGHLVVSKGSDEVIAWKGGKFVFNDTSLETILRQLARWYDVEIEYPNGIPQETFTGYIDRNLSAADALNILKYSNVNFKIQGRKIIVIK